MKLVFDFDHTLFSTKKFYNTLKEAFLEIGVDKNLFQETFQKSKGKSRNYNPFRQFELIKRQKPEISIEKLKKEFKKGLNQAQDFLYPDVLPFLKRIKNRFNLTLLSYGRDWFQREKIKKSKMNKFFKEIFITSDINKVSTLKKFLKNKEKIIFIDDNPEALSETKKVFPSLITVRINRGEGRYANNPDNSKINFSIKNLKKLTKIINRQR